jgi:hypothetical protein
MLEKELRAPVIAWLEDLSFLTAVEFHIHHMADIVAGRYGPRTSRRKPTLERCVAVELKLEDVAGVIDQARSNRYQTHYSYCAMPEWRVAKMKARTLDKFRDEGLGLLSVDGDAIQVLVAAKYGHGPTKRIIDNLWRRVRKEFNERWEPVSASAVHCRREASHLPLAHKSGRRGLYGD